MNATILLLASVFGQIGDPPQLQLDPPALKGEKVPAPKAAFINYDQAIAARKLPFVAFVGVKPRSLAGVTVATAKAIYHEDAWQTSGVIVVREDGYVWLPANADDAMIRRQLKAVEATPRFFDKLRERRTADGDLDGHGPWPKAIAKPTGLVRYKRAEWTQQTEILNGHETTTPVHRANVARKWHQSGGMEGVTGYRSDVYRLIPITPVVEKKALGVWNGTFWRYQNNTIVYENGEPKKALQFLPTWQRQYADGTRFDDVLSNTDTGKVFEHRSAEKRNGEWTRKVIFSDVAQRPAGYTGLTVTCSSCHSEAGTGGYATGLVPGGDEILSDPFTALEQP